MILDKEWLTIEEFMEALYGPDWLNHPDYLDGKEWVRDKFYNGGELPSERGGSMNSGTQTI